MEKEKIVSCDFVRAICAMGIIAYHFCCHLPDDVFKPFYSFMNINWGECIVTIFFVLSGAMLYYNNKEIHSLKKFYYKRWKSIFPMFYIAYLTMFLLNVVRYKNVFYKGNPKSLILSLLGMDGYFLYRHDNYYILGEWFLGAIIILYMLYPILLWLLHKSEIFLGLIVLALYLWQINTNIFIIDSFRNIFSCLISFTIGMLIISHNILNKNIVQWMLGIMIICTVIPLNSNIKVHIVGVCLFFVLNWCGKWLMNTPVLKIFFLKLSQLSYAIFLLQHIIVIRILTIIQPSVPVNVMLLMGITMVIIVVMAQILSFIVNILNILPVKLVKTLDV